MSDASDFGGPGGLPELDLRMWAEKVTRELRRDWTLKQLGPVMTVTEAMAVLNRSRSWVHRKIAEGRLNAWKDEATNRLRILREYIEYLASPDSPEERKRLERRGGTWERLDLAKVGTKAELESEPVDDLAAELSAAIIRSRFTRRRGRKPMS